MLTEMVGNFDAQSSIEIPDALSSVPPPLQWSPVPFAEYPEISEIVEDSTEPVTTDLPTMPLRTAVLQLDERVPIAALLLERIRLADRAADPVDPLRSGSKVHRAKKRRTRLAGRSRVHRW